MNREERDRILEAVPVDDADAALRSVVRTLDEHGELDRALCVELAHLTGDAADFWERLIAARDTWRSAHGKTPAPMPFALGE